MEVSTSFPTFNNFFVANEKKKQNWSDYKAKDAIPLGGV